VAYVLLFFGILLTVAGTRGTQDKLFGLLQGDFTGQGSFIYWIAAIALVGAIGYIPGLKGFANAFLALILIVLILKAGDPNNPNGGVFQQFTNALKASETQPLPSNPASDANAGPSKTGFDLQSIEKLAQSLGGAVQGSGIGYQGSGNTGDFAYV
jgi:hypothetical protein